MSSLHARVLMVVLTMLQGGGAIAQNTAADGPKTTVIVERQVTSEPDEKSIYTASVLRPGQEKQPLALRSGATGFLPCSGLQPFDKRDLWGISFKGAELIAKIVYRNCQKPR